MFNLQEILLTEWNKEWLPAAIYLIGLALYHVTIILLPDAVAEYALDFLKTMLICAYPLGLILVRVNFGDIVFMCVLVPLIVLTVITMPRGEANPVSVWVKYFHQRLSLPKMLLKTTILIASGPAGFWIAGTILRLQLHSILLGFTKSTSIPTTCSSALNVSIYQGVVLEMLAVTYDAWFLAQNVSPNLILEAAIKVTNTGMLVLSGKRWSMKPKWCFVTINVRSFILKYNIVMC